MATQHATISPLFSPISLAGDPAHASAILADVRALVPMLRERATTTEHLRRVPDETVRALGEAGVFKMTVPTEYGGYALTPTQIGPVFAEIARGCGSTAWVAWVTAAGTQYASHFSEPLLAEMFAPDALGPFQSGAMNPGGPGVARRVAGGYMIKGRWPWASGCHHTRFHALGALLEREEGGKAAVICQVPHEQVEILDDWFVTGMKGSGSNTIVLEDEVFVPEYRTIQSADMFAGKRLGPAPHGTLFKIHLTQFTPGLLSTLGIGLARAAIELLEERATRRGITFTDYKSQIAAPVTHLLLGEMHATLMAAEALCDRLLARMEQAAERGEARTPRATSAIRLSSAHVLQLCHGIANTALRASGASAIQSDDPAQRYVRDTLTLTMHGQMNIETAYEDYGRIVAGVPGFGGVGGKKP